ncbi:hypothetical protein B0H14DRAFT_2598227 [Mycena olivaceomarginata]|nr:hypothetical protein B0H14DRAFT_2598227 [Mycena olivaceomarginata]
MGAGVQNERGVMGAGACKCAERGWVHARGIKGSAGGRRAEGCKCKHGDQKGGVGGTCAEQAWVQVQPQKAAFRITTDSAKRPRIEPKKLFFGGTGIRDSGVLLKSGAVGYPTNFLVPPVAGGAPHLKEVWGAPHPVFVKCGAAPPGVELPMKLGKELTLWVPKKGSLRCTSSAQKHAVFGAGPSPIIPLSPWSRDQAHGCMLTAQAALSDLMLYEAALSPHAYNVQGDQEDGQGEEQGQEGSACAQHGSGVGTPSSPGEQKRVRERADGYGVAAGSGG